MLAVFVLAGCPPDDESTTPPKPSATAATTAAPPTTTSTPPTQLTVDTGATAGGTAARVKTELDGRSDGATGSGLAVAGAKASFSSATGWKTGKAGTWTTATAADDKARFGAGALGASDDAAAKATEAATAMSLTDCKWNPSETITTGKDKLSATVADGTCKRGGADAPAAYAAFAGEGLLGVGSWDAAGGDSNSMFGIFRSVKKAGTGDATGIGACCSALRQNAASAPPQQQGAYLAAAGACEAVRSSPQGRAALGQVRALLMGASVPASCQ